jgi:photosystem II stability/assembly factor-like uncharacterized protein
MMNNNNGFQFSRRGFLELSTHGAAAVCGGPLILRGSAAATATMGEWKSWPGIWPTIDGAQATAVISMAVDQQRGSLHAFMTFGKNRKGIIGRSDDGGTTFKPVGEWAGEFVRSASMCVEPAPGGRLARFCLYGGPIGCGMLEGPAGDWSCFPEWKPKNFEVGSIDWENTGKAVLAFGHEDGGRLALSVDGGKLWKEVGKGFKPPVGIIDAQTLFACKWGKGLMRSDDGGATWTTVLDMKVDACQAVTIRKGIAYLANDEGLQVSTDKGMTWRQLAKEEHADGPYFGKDDGNLLLVCERGIIETKDNGVTWKVVAPYPPEAEKTRNCFAWDSVHRTLYVARSIWSKSLPPLQCAIP